ncbi:MAG: hypothetical protein J6E38_00930 [Clostridia bacterium]|nr:hypothetical protein [Clostridia bacterium]
MIFDTRDFGVLNLCGLCRYIPSDLWRYYDSELFTATAMFTLEERGYIKMQSNGESYKLTYKGREALAEMGYTYSEDMRLDLKRPAYRRRLKNAHCNVTMHLAGIDVFCRNTSELAEKDIGYLSSLMVRTSRNKSLAGTRFLGILKIGETASVVYYIENEEDWIIPGYEKETFASLISTVRSVNKTKLILAGKSLEELWKVTHPQNQSEKLPRGMTRFDRALEELGYDYSLVPLGRDGVAQLSLLRSWGYRESIANGLGYVDIIPSQLSMCDGMKDGVPCIIAVDVNIRRLIRTLKQCLQYDRSMIPMIYCFPFQKPVVLDMLKKYKTQRCLVQPIDKNKTVMYYSDPVDEIVYDEPYITKEGSKVSANEKKVERTNSKAFET